MVAVPVVPELKADELVPEAILLAEAAFDD